MWKGIFHETGRLFCTDNASSNTFDRAVENTRPFADTGKIEELKDAEAIKTRVPQLTGQMMGWRGIMNGSAGWVSPKDALAVLASACTRLGVTFHSGPSAAVTKILSNGNIVEGVCTEDDTVHSASIIVLAAGAWSETLVDFERQLVAVTYGVCQLQLTHEERRAFSWVS
jgi:glycine/D-amino acid oxidase-like deaminating enzyme